MHGRSDRPRSPIRRCRRLPAHHGTGLGAALLDAVVRADGTASLWVADPNPRAQAFYRKHRFDFDGAGRVESGVRELRMARTGQ